MKVLVDTSIIVDFLRRDDKEAALFFRLADKQYQLFASMITHTELYAGKSVWERKDATEELVLLFSGVTLLSIDEKVSKKAGELRARFNVNILDAIIAATALMHKLPLVTLNAKDFTGIKGLRLMTAETISSPS